MDYEVLTSVNCTVKVYSSQQRRNPVQHTCKFSLAAVNGVQPCFVLEGAGIGKPRKMKFAASDLDKVVAKRISDGRLSVIVRNQDWDTVAISDAHDRRALGQLHQLLETIITGTFPKGNFRGQSATPPSLLVNRRSPGDQSSSSKSSRQYSLVSHSANWRGASMVAAAQAKSRTTPSHQKTSFYGSPAPDSSLSSSLLCAPGEGSGGRSAPKSAKRVLVLDGEGDKDDFLPSPKYRPPQDHAPKRPPLGALSTVPQSGNAVVARGSGKLEQLLRSDMDPDGFANLGNTCYMNAVLQSLLGLYPFAEDLLSPSLVKNVLPNSLYRMVVMLLKCKRSKDSFDNQKILLKKIKAAISKHAQKFVGFIQQDAHELLSQCLDQLKDDCQHVSNLGNKSEPATLPSPVVTNFESNIEHRITCKGCGHVTRTSQVGYDFSLQLPKSVHRRPNEQASLQQLFDQFFADEEVEFNCTNCKCNSATLSLQLSKLPRILILHLKRYGYNCQLSENSKRVDNIRIPRYINIGHLAKSQCDPPSVFISPDPRNISTLSSVLGQSEEKENVPSSSESIIAQEPTIITQEPAIIIQKPAATTQEPAIIAQKPGVTTQEPAPQLKAMLTENNTPSTITPPTSPIYNQTTLHAHTGLTPQTTPHAYSMLHTTHTSRDNPIVILHCEDKETNRKCSGATQTSNTKSLLGKRKSSERHDEVEDYTSIKTSCTTSERVGSSVSESEDPIGCSRSSHVNGTGMGSSTGADSGTRVNYGTQFVDESSQQSMEFDRFFESVPLDDLTGSIAPSTSPKQTTSPMSPDLTTQCSSLTTPPKTDLCASTGQESLSEIKPQAGVSSEISGQDGIPLSSLSAEVNIQESGGLERSVSPLFDQEQADFQRAVEESLRAQPSEFQLEGLSEEEQLRLALELSIQDSIPTEITSSTSPIQTDDLPSAKATPTPEKHSETFRLVSIVNHIGKGSAGGHYISDVYSFPDQCWRTYNDSQVSDVREEDVRQRRQTTGYIFFYLHRSTFTSVSAHFGR